MNGHNVPVRECRGLGQFHYYCFFFFLLNFAARYDRNSLAGKIQYNIIIIGGYRIEKNKTKPEVINRRVETSGEFVPFRRRVSLRGRRHYNIIMRKKKKNNNNMNLF